MSTFLTEDITSGRNWRALERAVARIMLHLGWHDVTVIGGAGDQGGDVLGTKYEPQIGVERSWVVQCKAVTGSNYVGKAAVDEAIHGLSKYDASIAAVATNGEFTASAIKRKDDLCSGGFDTRLWNGVVLRGLVDRMPDRPIKQRSLRSYQKTIVDKVVEKFQKGDKKAFYIVATGLGKTVIAASIAMQLWEAGCRRILVLCHATDLAMQLEQGFWPQITKQIPTSVFYGGVPPKSTEGICFGLYQSLLGYLPGIEPDRFDAIIVDEAHHAMAQGFRRCIDTLKPKFLIGMTATPWRGDGKLLTEVFGEPVEKVSLVDGMAMGYLSKVDYRIFCDNINWDEVDKLAKTRVSMRDLNRRLFLPQRDEAVIAEIKKVAAGIKNPRIAIFSPSLKHSEHFANLLSGSGIPCTSLSCSDKIERRRRLLAFSSGKYTAVTAVDVMNEGIDVPDVNILVFLRATHSRRIFVQQLGRGLRIADDKEKVVVLDFVSDIRRLADVIDFNNEGKEAGLKREVLFLQDGVVTFTNERMAEFVQMWLEDVADLGNVDDSAQLTFPEGM